MTTSAAPAPSLPHPPWRLPFFGDILHFRVTSAMDKMKGLADQLGPLFEIQAFGARFLVVAGAEAVRDFNDESRFAKGTGPGLDALRPIAGDGLFTAYNDEPNWLAAHQLLMPAFSQEAMRRYHPIMLDVVDELTARWDRRVGADPVDVAADMTRATLETIGRSAAGFEFGCFADERVHPFVEHMIGGLEAARFSGFLEMTWLPSLLTRIARQRTEHYGRKLHAIVDEIIAARRADAAGEHDDLLALMLAPGPDGRPVLDDDNIRYQLITFLVAGHETTSGALSFALYYLSRRPQVYAKARDEVRRVWGDAARPDYDQVTRLRYVRRVLEESLRLHPTVPGYIRVARADTRLSDGRLIRKGEAAAVFVAQLHRDPQWGENVDEFDPERFAPERSRGRDPQLYKPFGTGERACIGRQFAMHEAILVLGALIRRYDLIPDPDYRLKVTERLTIMPRDFRLRLRPAA